MYGYERLSISQIIVEIEIEIGIEGMDILIRPLTCLTVPRVYGSWPLVGHVPDFPVCIAFIAAGCRGRWTGLEGPRGAVVPDIEPSKQDLPIG